MTITGLYMIAVGILMVVVSCKRRAKYVLLIAFTGGCFCLVGAIVASVGVFK